MPLFSRRRQPPAQPQAPAQLRFPRRRPVTRRRCSAKRSARISGPRSPWTASRQPAPGWKPCTCKPRPPAAQPGIPPRRTPGSGSRTCGATRKAAATTPSPRSTRPSPPHADRDNVWDAYLNYVTYGISAQFLLDITAAMPPRIRAARIGMLLSVAEQHDRWGTMPVEEGKTYLSRLPDLLRQLGDDESLGGCLSVLGLREEREGSHAEAVAILAEAAATGHATPAAVDRLTVHLVKAEQWAKARTALAAALAQRSRATRCANVSRGGSPAANGSSAREPWPAGSPRPRRPGPAAGSPHLRTRASRPSHRNARARVHAGTPRRTSPLSAAGHAAR